MATPLIAMLGKNSFVWMDDASAALEKLKLAYDLHSSSCPACFSIPFVVECDASDFGIGQVLQQNGRPIAFFSHTLALCHHPLPAYEKELSGFAKAVRNWRLVGLSFLCSNRSLWS